MKFLGKEIKGVIFDLDGTLLESSLVWYEVDLNFFKKRGIVMPSDYGDKIAHIGLDNAAKYTIKEFNLNEKKEDIIREWKEAVYEKYAKEIALKPNALKFLHFLHDNNIPFCVATANDRDCYEGALINNGCFDLFKFFLEINHVGKTKDQPDIFLKAAELLGCKAIEAVVFEDLPLALNTAKKVGFNVVAVKDESYKEKDELIKKEIGDAYIIDYDELYKYFEK